MKTHVQKTYPIAFILAILFPFVVSTQEILVKKTGEIYPVIIQEYNDSTIVYFKVGDPDSIIYDSPKSLLHQIIFNSANNRSNVEVDWGFWENTPRMNFRFGVTSLFQNSILLGMEYLITPKIAGELNVIRHTKVFEVSNDLFHIEGWGLEGGIKYFLSRKPKITEEYKLKSLLAGTYLNAKFYYTDRREFSFDEISKYWALIGGVQIGHQLKLGSNFNIDTYGGLHLVTGKNTISPIDGRFVIPGKLYLNDYDYIGEHNFSFTLGIKLGYYF